ncbi:IucA/IucC family protein [Paenibacillus herberti]|uniref:IucA/IucC family siderophore biosynthesis protein n=1 Tax=Paenibacillus herberti TaxID=1619309 RepID=A0A229P068_9BACL|nr:IucA/IucC family protein [Paenibacillus herberti]OXM15590.1 IucA/IucC family siderophore biosynthesis protein [Paenibacillus herberti]
MQTSIIPVEGSKAQRQIMKDLMDALLFEQFFRFDETTVIPLAERPELGQLFAGRTGTLAYDGEIRFLIEPSLRQQYQWVSSAPIYINGDRGWQEVYSPRELCQVVLRSMLSDEAYAAQGVNDFLDGLDVAVRQLQLSMEQSAVPLRFKPSNGHEWMLKGEMIASLRDRPFHPLAKAKIGLADEDYASYMSEFGQPTAMRWVAIKNECIVRGSELEELELLDILDGRERAEVESELAQKKLSEASYTVLPVHPWQLEHKIIPDFQRELTDGTLVVLDVQTGSFRATSSVRSFAASEQSELMLKLPLSVLSLGAARYLPVVKLLNGLAGERMLRQAIASDETLADKIYLCEENNWWGYMPESMGLFDDHPRHLAAQIRMLPREALQAGYRIVPMSSLGVLREEGHFLTELLGGNITRESVLSFYAEAAALFYDVVMRLFKVGVVPEIHGQNCCLVLSGDRPIALLLRDHDSVRLHQPYLDKHGIGDPRYHIRPGYSNSLYNETLEKLIFYVQSLGTQVNLASIMESLSEAYEIPIRELWEITESAWRNALDAVDLPQADRELLREVIFESKSWPVKQIVRPLLEAEGVPGAMPSGKGLGPNPFVLLRQNQL